MLNRLRQISLLPVALSAFTLLPSYAFGAQSDSGNLYLYAPKGWSVTIKHHIGHYRCQPTRVTDSIQGGITRLISYCDFNSFALGDSAMHWDSFTRFSSNTENCSFKITTYCEIDKKNVFNSLVDLRPSGDTIIKNCHIHPDDLKIACPSLHFANQIQSGTNNDNVTVSFSAN